MKTKTLLKVFVYLVCFIVIFGITFQAKAQKWTEVKSLPEKEVEFQKALYQYKVKNYQSAFIDFETLSNSRDLHQRITASLLMTGKSLYHLDRYLEAIPYFEKLINYFPQSRYVDDAHYAKASCDFRLGIYTSSVSDFLWVVDWSSQDALVSKSKRLANSIMRSNISLSELYKLQKLVNGEKSAALVTLELAKRELLEGSSENAVSILKYYKKRYNSNIYSSTIDQLLKEAERGDKRPFKVGVLLPLTGYFAEEGLGILRGIQYSQMVEKNNSGVPIQLFVRDSESNMITAIHEIKRLVKKDKVRAVIGELESEITAGIGALASLDHIPVIGPSATENDVASVGEAVFQLNSNLERKGEALAQYAYNVLGLRTFATLAPGDDYGQQLTDSFNAKIDQLGGRIIAQSWYYGNAENLTRQFKNMREAAFHYDSTDVEQLIEEAEERGDRLKERDIPVLSIDGIFFPVYSDDIPYVAAQFASSNIRAQILGGEYWDNAEILSAAQIERHVNGAIFVSDFFPNEESRDFINFRNGFRISMKTTPERWEVFGYDAMNVLCKSLKEGAKTGQQIKQRLSSLDEYNGIKGMISFKDNNRVNKEVNFLQFLNGKIIKHQY